MATELGSGVRLIALTMMRSTRESEQALKAGAHLCLSHPLLQDDVRHSLHPSTHHSQQADGSLVPTAKPSLVHCTVLVAEDNDVNREIVTAMLRSMGCQVLTAKDGLEAVQISASEPHDLILMDVQMPEMDGMAACRAIRSRETEQGLPRKPIVALTANALTDDRDNCLAAGMDDYLTKPFMRAQLLGLVQRWSRVPG